MKRPFVFINMAMSADGKIATHAGEGSFGSRTDHKNLLALRDKANAILTGAGTVNAQPEVTLGPGPRSKMNPPLRVIASGRGNLDLGHKIFRSKGAPILILTTDQIPAKTQKALEAKADVWVCGEKTIDFKRALERLRGERGMKRLVCEGGGMLNDALLRAGVVDEVNLTICPLLIGGKSAPTIADGLGMERLATAKKFELKSKKQVEDELFLVYRPVNRRAKT